MNYTKKIQSEKLTTLKAKYLPQEKRTSYIIIAIFIWASWATLGTIRNNHQLQNQVDQLNDKISQLNIENERIEFSNTFYETEEYLELSARQNLNKLAPGEKAFITPERDDLFDQKPVQQEVTVAKRSNFAQWLNFLFSIDI